MQVHEPMIQNFMAGYKRHEPVIMDSTAMMQYKACPRMYFYRIVLGFSPKKAPAYFAFGSAYHKFREVLERDTFAGLTVQEAYLNALDVATKLHAKNPALDDKDKFHFLTTNRLIASCEVAFKHWLMERKQGAIKVIAYEQPFALQLGDVIIAGRADNIVDWRGLPWGRDFKTSTKTGPYYERSLEPNDQFTRYTWGESKLTGKDVKGQIIEVVYNTAKEGPRIDTYTTERTPGQLKRWELEHGFWMQQINQSREQDMYPMNEKSCWNCAYHSVCKSRSESGQMSQLKTYFKIEPWDCTKTPDE
jgi:hypothetical protein